MDESLTLLGLSVPDSALSRRARELITDFAAPFLVNHSVRVYAWAVELAGHDRLQSDPEILYVSACSTTSAWFRRTTSAAATRSTARWRRSGSGAKPVNRRRTPERSTT